MKRYVSLAVIMLLSLFLLLFGAMFHVFTNTSIKYMNNQTAEGKITQTSTNGLIKQYQVQYQVGENVYSSEFTITGVNLGEKGDEIGLILGTQNETVAIQELVGLEQSIYYITGYIVLISLILLILSIVLFFVLDKLEDKKNVYVETLCERKEHI